MKKAIILVSDSALPLAKKVQKELEGADIYTKSALEGCRTVDAYSELLEKEFDSLEALVFIGAIGICVRTIAPFVKDKYTDPAVVVVDSTGRFVVPVLSGHVGGANALSERLAAALGGTAVVTTQSDNQQLWALDTLAATYGWRCEASKAEMNEAISRFVGGRPTALLLETKDRGTAFLEQHLPAHVTLYTRFEEIPQAEVELIVAVTPRIYQAEQPLLCYRPAVLQIGVGCQKEICPEGIAEYIGQELRKAGLSPLSLASVCSIELKKDEPLLQALLQAWPGTTLQIFKPEELQGIEVPNPSEKVFETTGVYGVAETTALKGAHFGELLLEKQKGCVHEGEWFTFAVALEANAMRGGHIEIVGAGPGDPDLISVRGRAFLEQADLILYAGSLVPRELTFCAKEGAVVRSSASLDLEEQFALMKEFYDRGELVVRLHTGDPCIYGAIQEQMNFFDRYGMRYHITPGISSFQAAAAALRSQFTIPERVQTIILTRGEGRTPMPEKEKLHLLARSQSTMCIFLSASVVEQVQAELLECYPPTTPVAACYKLTWKDERIYRGELKDLARIVKENGLTLTTMIVVGDAIDNRQGLSRLYAHEFKHLFRS